MGLGPESESGSPAEVLPRPVAPGPGPLPYRGRFAPSPTGPLHFGSLVAAVGSFLAARHAGGQWLVRIEDLDPPREVPGSADQILHTLEAFGLDWDEAVVYQSHRREAYEAAARQLQSSGLAYECTCSRTEIAAAAGNCDPALEELHYPGWCRQRPLVAGRTRALRFVASNERVSFVDGIQGEISGSVGTECGDFVIRRRDGQFAYQLAVTVDDAAQGITHIVRGADLLTSTLRQILLQRALGVQTPAYAHLPLAVDKSSRKLSKSTGAVALSERNQSAQLWHSLEFLRQEPPIGLRPAPLREILDWGIHHWNPEALPGQRSLPIEISDC